MKVRLIVHIDFSLRTEQLLRHAFLWADNMGADLLLIHQVQPLLPTLTDIQTRSEVLIHEKKRAKGKILSLLDKIPQSESCSVKIKVFKHSLLLKLQKIIGNGDTLFMFHSKRSALDFLPYNGFELQAAKVLSIPVIILPQEFFLSMPSKFFIGVRNIELLNVRVLHSFLKKLNPQNIKLIFFTILNSNVQVNGHYLKNVAQTYANNFDVYDHIFIDENTLGLIKNLISSKGGEILLLQKEHKSLIGQLFQKSTITTLLRERKTPMIILPEV